MRFVPVLLALASCVWLTSSAQEPKSQPKPGEKTAKADKNEPVAGRKTKKIEGFTFLLSEEALNADASKYERPPLEVLDYECKLLIKMLSPKAVDLLRRLTVFVDWDEKITLSNGRDGVALASYYGGGAQQMVKEGRHPLQAKTVTIHTLKSLTEQRQPKNDSRVSCLLLHEFAHAVHDQLFGFDHAGIKAAYEQAMERKLYEKDFYAATNPREFFAELSCTYLDRLHYYPHNRDELKKHDPVTFKTMESVWTGATASKVAKVPPPHAEKGNLDLSLPTDVKFGPVVNGPNAAVDKLAGKVVLIGYWGGLHANVLDRLERLQAELGTYGLVVVCPNTLVREDDLIKADAEKRGGSVTVLRNAFVKEGSGPEFKSQLGGHALVFDSTGKCVHRGSAYDIEGPVRAAVGKLLLTTACGPDEAPKAFKPVADAFAAGGSPVSVVSKVAPLTTSADEDVKTKAKKLQELILAPGQKALAEVQASVKTDPVSAFIGAEKLAVSFKNTPVGTKAATIVSTLRIDKAVVAELKARTQAAEIEKLAGKLRGQEGSIKPAEASFQSKHQQALAQMKTLLDQLRKQHPTARATAEAEKAAREFSVP